MEKKLESKIAVITGASSGIGKAIALRLAKEGATIVLFGGRNEARLTAAQEEIEALGVKSLAIRGDLTDFETIEDGLRMVNYQFGKIDVLINDAGSAFSGPFEAVTEKQFDDIMTLDVKVPFFLTQQALPYLRKSDSATIVNVASVVGHSGYALQSAYSMAKHALLGFTKSLAREVYQEGIRVHVISPGGVYTDMVKQTRPDLAPESVILPEDVAEAVAFLVTNRCSAVIDELLLHRISKEPFSV